MPVIAVGVALVALKSGEMDEKVAIVGLVTGMPLVMSLVARGWWCCQVKTTLMEAACEELSYPLRLVELVCEVIDLDAC